MPSCLAIRHVAFEDLGSFEAILAERGFDIRFVEAPDGLDDVDPSAQALMAILGGPIGVYEDASYPFLRREIEIAATRVAAGLPTLGICLGAQIIARALGAEVYPGVAKEIGWAPVNLSEAGRASPLGRLDGVPVLHWHGDTFDLPEDARLLASTSLYPRQAFAFGAATLALQFHPEVSARELERWLIGHAVEIASVAGISVGELRDQGARHGERLALAARAFFSEWLEQVGL